MICVNKLAADGRGKVSLLQGQGRKVIWAVMTFSYLQNFQWKLIYNPGSASWVLTAADDEKQDIGLSFRPISLFPEAA